MSAAGRAATAAARTPTANEWWLGSVHPTIPPAEPAAVDTAFGAYMRRSSRLRRRHQGVASSANGSDTVRSTITVPNLHTQVLRAQHFIRRDALSRAPLCSTGDLPPAGPAGGGGGAGGRDERRQGGAGPGQRL